MSKILLSIKPEWTAKILNGEKTIEIRKSAPKCDLPIDVYIYCTKGKEGLWYVKNKTNANGHAYIGKNVEPILNGKVVAKFTMREIRNVIKSKIWGGWGVYGEYMDFIEIDRMSCLSQNEIMRYMRGKYHAYAWHISDLEIFDEPKELSEFGIKRAPQSWQYVEEYKEGE